MWKKKLARTPQSPESAGTIARRMEESGIRDTVDVLAQVKKEKHSSIVIIRCTVTACRYRTLHHRGICVYSEI